MRATNSLARWGLAACLVGSAGLQAQDTGFSKDFKIRLAYAPSPKDNLSGAYQGFGLNLGYGLGIGRIGLELGYLYKTGDPYATAPDGSRIRTFEPYPNDPDQSPIPGAAMDPSNSAEEKRNEISGFAIRISWQQKLWEEWSWQAGLQFGPQYKHQYLGDARSVAATQYRPGIRGTKAWRENYEGVPREGVLNNISLYGGMTWNIDKDSSFEFNLMLLRYKAINYYHYAGTGTYYTSGDQVGFNDPTVPWPYDKLEKRNRMVPHLEIGYVFHF